MIDDKCGYYQRPGRVVFDAKTAVEWARTQQNVGQGVTYNAIWHNCEHFAYLCMHSGCQHPQLGRVTSSQLDDVGIRCATCLTALCFLAVLVAMFVQNINVWDAVPALRWNPAFMVSNISFRTGPPVTFTFTRAMKLGNVAPDLQCGQAC